MNILHRTLPFLALAGSLPAQLTDQATLIERREAKLAAPFMEEAMWHADYDDAREDAAGSGKFIFAYFTRSYSP